MVRNRRRRGNKKPLFGENSKLASLVGQKALQRAQKYLEVAGDVADAVIRLRDKPGVPDYVAVGLKFVQSVADATSGNMYNYFTDGWTDIEDWGFSDDIIDICAEYGPEELFNNDSFSLFQVEIPGVTQEKEIIGWTQEHEYKSGPFLRTDRFEDSLMAIGRAIWESAESRALELATLGYQGAASEAKTRSECVLRKDTSRNDPVYESELAIKILERIKLFENKGFNRSIMLLGPPGTGKTSIMKYVANKLDVMSLRVNVGQLDNINPRDIVRAVDLLKPKMLMIDDFDRFEHAHSMLTELEQVNKSVKIFMVTANSTENLDDAVLRPGRFDEIVDVTEIDPNIVEKLLGNVSDDLREHLKSWPVAFIAEFHKRREVLGDEGAISELEEFHDRLVEIIGEEEFDDDDDDDEEEKQEVKNTIPRVKVGKNGEPIITPEVKKAMARLKRKINI